MFGLKVCIAVLSALSLLSLLVFCLCSVSGMAEREMEEVLRREPTTKREEL